MTGDATLVLSHVDSERFGLRVFRGTICSIDERSLFQELVAESIDIAIVRTPAGAGAALNRLGRFGIHPLHADTLVYYQVALDAYEPRPLRNADLAFSEALPSDRGELESLVASTFNDYTSHYHANPLLDRDSILAGYAEWAAGYLAGGDARTAWVARRGGAIVAFACCSHDDATGICEGILYGVRPDSAGGGLYGDLIRHTQAQFRNRGFHTMKVSTQVWNLAVQKVWNREGFVLTQAFDTYHVNALLGAGETVLEEEIQFTSSQVAQFAHVTGDTNAIHLDDAAARNAGFESRISHGMLAGSELSRIFGTRMPGFGTLFLRSELAFMAPIYPDRKHVLKVRFPGKHPRSGHVPAIATIHDAAGKLCLLAYNDLLKR